MVLYKIAPVINAATWDNANSTRTTTFKYSYFRNVYKRVYYEGESSLQTLLWKVIRTVSTIHGETAVLTGY